MLKQSTIDEIRHKLSDLRTQNVSVYDPEGYESLETYVLLSRWVDVLLTTNLDRELRTLLQQIILD